MRWYELRPHHRRRHRKKLRLAEFAEIGFPIASLAMIPAAVTALLGFVDQQGWSFDGERQPLEGFITRFGGGSLTEVDRELLRQWLLGQGVSDVKLGALQDYWRWVTG